MSKIAKLFGVLAVVAGLAGAPAMPGAVGQGIQFADAKQEVANKIFSEAFKLYENGDLDGALQKFLLGLKIDDNNAAAHFYYAELTIERYMNYGEAIPHYQRAIELGPDTREGIIAAVKLPELIEKHEQQEKYLQAKRARKAQGEQSKEQIMGVLQESLEGGNASAFVGIWQTGKFSNAHTNLAFDKKGNAYYYHYVDSKFCEWRGNYLFDRGVLSIQFNYGNRTCNEYYKKVYWNQRPYDVVLSCDEVGFFETFVLQGSLYTATLICSKKYSFGGEIERLAFLKYCNDPNLQLNRAERDLLKCADP